LEVSLLLRRFKTFKLFNRSAPFNPLLHPHPKRGRMKEGIEPFDSAQDRLCGAVEQLERFEPS